MFGVPKKERLVGLVGRELIQVCIASNQVILKFDRNAQINVESSIEHAAGHRGIRRYDNFWKEECPLTTLIGSSISGIDEVGDKTLGFQFSNGESIYLSDDSDEFESFHIEIEGELIVI